MTLQELWNEGAGLFAACFIAIVPGYISRSVAGSYDNEVILIDRITQELKLHDIYHLIFINVMSIADFLVY